MAFPALFVAGQHLECGDSEGVFGGGCRRDTLNTLRFRTRMPLIFFWPWFLDIIALYQQEGSLPTNRV